MRVDLLGGRPHHPRRTSQHAAPEQQPGRVEHSHEIRQRDPEQIAGLFEQPARELVALVRGALHRGGGHLVRLAGDLEQLPPDGRMPLAGRAGCRHRDAQVVARPRREVVPAGVGLEATALAAAAEPPVRMDEDMAELAGDARSALVQLAVEDDPRADAASDQHHDQVVHAPPRARRPLAPGGNAQVVPDPHRQPRRPRLHQLQKGYLAPAEVGRVHHHAGALLDPAGHAHAHALHLAERHSRRAAGRLGRAHDGFGHLWRLARQQPVLLLPEHMAAHIDDRGAHVGAAQIDADVELVTLHGRLELIRLRGPEANYASSLRIC